MDRLIEDERSRKMLLKFIENQKLPFVCKVTSGRIRSVEQNRLQHLWMAEIAHQLGDRTPEDVRAEFKLLFGVPIRCRDDRAYERDFQKLTDKMSYDQQVLMMRHYAVTRDMTSKQKAEYLDTINRHAAEMGWALTQPDMQGMAA